MEGCGKAEKSIGIWEEDFIRVNPWRCCHRQIARICPRLIDDRAAPTVATVVIEVCKIWESHLRAVSVAAIAGIAVCASACARDSSLLLG